MDTFFTITSLANSRAMHKDTWVVKSGLACDVGSMVKLLNNFLFFF